MQLDALNRVLAGGRWFSFNAGLEAVRAIPEVMDGLPHMTGEPPVIVVTCREVIKPLLRSPGIEADPLVGALYRLVEQGLVLSRGAAVVPLLETWRQMRLKVLALPPQGRAMEAAFQSSRLGAVVAVTPDIPALAKVICLEQAALMHTDQELEEDGETSARRRSLAIARLAASLRAPEDRSVEQLRWPRMDELKVGVLAVGLGALRSEGFRAEVDQRWQKLREALPEALWVDQGVVGLALSLKVPQLLQLDVAGILGAGVSAGFGYGVVQGGTDGLMTRVVGAPVEGALRAMVRGRKDEISLEEETLNALGPLLLGLGGRSVPGESRAWDLAGRRYTADLATSGVYTLRSRKVTVEAPVAEPFGEEFENMLAEAFGAAPSPVPSPPPSPAPSPAAGRIDPKRTAVFFGPGGPTSPTAPTAPAAPPAPNRSFPPQSTEVTQTGARLRTVVPEATVVEKKPPPPPVVPPEESWRNVPKAPSAEASAGVRRVPPAPAPAPVETRPSRKPSLADTSLQDEDTRSTRKLPTPAEERSKSSRKPPPPAVVAEESPRPPPKVPPPAIVPEAPARRGKSFVHPPAFVEPIRRGSAALATAPEQPAPSLDVPPPPLMLPESDDIEALLGQVTPEEEPWHEEEESEPPFDIEVDDEWEDEPTEDLPAWNEPKPSSRWSMPEPSGERPSSFSFPENHRSTSSFSGEDLSFSMPDESDEPAGYLPGPPDPEGYLPGPEETAGYLPGVDADDDDAAFAVVEEDQTPFSFSDEAAVDEPPSKPKPPRPPPPPPPDFRYLLAGYCWYVDGNTTVFGRTYGRRLLDYHRFPSSQPAEAHQLFLEQKIREGFLPQPDLVGDPPLGLRPQPLDEALLKAAWVKVA